MRDLRRDIRRMVEDIEQLRDAVQWRREADLADVAAFRSIYGAGAAAAGQYAVERIDEVLAAWGQDGLG